MKETMHDRSPPVAPLVSRRQWLSGATLLAAAGTFSSSLLGCQERSSRLVCSDPSKLSDAETNMRTSVHYVEQSATTGQSCAGCAFFESASGQPCGSCNLLKGSVNPNGRCDSWSAAKS